jgi:Family of unknown function (DUF6011)
MSETAAPDMAKVMEEIRELAATRRHHLAGSMTGGKSLAPAQAMGVLQHLRNCPPLDGQAPAASAQPRGDVSRETSPAAPPRLSEFKNVPAGFFATISKKAGNDVIDFWKVHPGKGKWASVKFVRRVLGGINPNDGYRTEQLDNMQMRLAFQAITEYGLDEAQSLFADKMRRCIDCASPLTDPVSRAARRGETCRNKLAQRQGLI